MEQLISLGIVNSYFEKLKNNLSVDVAIVGGGPSGLVAGFYLARAGYKVCLYERKLAPGGGMWGGAMMFNQIVVQKEALSVINDFGVDYQLFHDNLYVIDSVQATGALIYNTSKAGCTIFNCISIEDVVLQNNKVNGLVINWAPVHREHLHVDPLIILHPQPFMFICHVVGGKMILNDAGKMVEKLYFELMNKFPDIQCDQYIIMPNHTHFIVINVGADLHVCPIENKNTPDEHTPDEHTGSPQRDIIQWFT